MPSSLHLLIGQASGSMYSVPCDLRRMDVEPVTLKGQGLEETLEASLSGKPVVELVICREAASLGDHQTFPR